MGSGKTYVMRNLAQQKLFPLHNFVQISQDTIKHKLPEFHGYLQYDECTVGYKLRQESGYLQEVIMWESIFNGNCIWVDSSLRNSLYHEKLFHSIRQDFDDYRIAIIWVRADSDIVFKRAFSKSENNISCCNR
eukprot:UN04879